jgi:hypothetical protein
MKRRSADRERLALVVAGAIVIGIHAGLAPDQLREWAPLGASFVVAACLLGLGVAIAAAGRGDVHSAATLLAFLFASLIVSYAATRVVALPPLDPTREPLDPLGIATTVIEAAGLVVALRLTRQQQPQPMPGGNQ